MIPDIYKIIYKIDMKKLIYYITYIFKKVYSFTIYVNIQNIYTYDIR